MTKEEIIRYWHDSAEDNYQSMQNMFNSKEYVWALFVGHLCIEKLLKSCYVKNVENIAPGFTISTNWLSSVGWR